MKKLFYIAMLFLLMTACSSEEKFKVGDKVTIVDHGIAGTVIGVDGGCVCGGGPTYSVEYLDSNGVIQQIPNLEEVRLAKRDTAFSGDVEYSK